MLDKFFKSHYLKTVVNYSEKLASNEVTDPKEAEDCHWAKLVLYTDIEMRVISLNTIAESNHESAVPQILREINLLTQKQLNGRTSELVNNLYAILCDRAS